MKKPNHAALWIYDNYPITNLKWLDVPHVIRQEHPDWGYTEYYVVLTAGNGETLAVAIPTFVGLSELLIRNKSFVQLRPTAFAEARAYREWEKTNAKDLAEFKRLAAKLGIDS